MIAGCEGKGPGMELSAFGEWKIDRSDGEEDWSMRGQMDGRGCWISRTW